MNLPVFDDLLNIAEIASVFLGFTVLVTALTPSRIDMVRIMAVVIGTSMTIVLCLLPILLRTYSDNAAAVIRISGVLWIILNISATVAMVKYIPGFKEVQKEDKTGAAVVWLLEALAYLCLTLGVLGIWEGISITLYFAAVFSLIFQSVFLFILLVLSISKSGSIESNPEN